jgi:hypothetical protein
LPAVSETAGDRNLGVEGGRRPGGRHDDARGGGLRSRRGRRNGLQSLNDDDAGRRGGRQAGGLHLADGAVAVRFAVVGEDVKRRRGEKENRDERCDPAFHALSITN